MCGRDRRPARNGISRFMGVLMRPTGGPVRHANRTQLRTEPVCYEEVHSREMTVDDQKAEMRGLTWKERRKCAASASGKTYARLVEGMAVKAVTVPNPIYGNRQGMRDWERCSSP